MRLKGKLVDGIYFKSESTPNSCGMVQVGDAEIELTEVRKSELKYGQMVLVRECMGQKGDFEDMLEKDVVAIIPEEVKEECNHALAPEWLDISVCEKCPICGKYKVKEKESEIDFKELDIKPHELGSDVALANKFHKLVDIIEKLWKEKKCIG